MGLGPYPDVSLADARNKAAECRRLRVDDIDPLEAKRAAKEQRLLAELGQTSFKECAEAYIALQEPAWKNPKHRQQWRNTLSTYAYPKIGDVGIAKIDARLVLSVLEPIWLARPETASRLRGRLEAILDWAKVRKMREGENPAVWKANLSHALPRKAKVRSVRHHRAMDYSLLPSFFETLKGGSLAELALRFLILTAARTGEVIYASWQEMDLVNGVWTIPGARMKAGREHRVPLSDHARFILAKARIAGPNNHFVFPGRSGSKALSNMAMMQVLKRANLDVTAHGFRSSFRDWAAEETNFSNDVIEMALAHSIESKVEAAYRRGDLFIKRRALMGDWARFIGPSFAGRLSLANSNEHLPSA